MPGERVLWIRFKLNHFTCTTYLYVNTCDMKKVEMKDKVFGKLKVLHEDLSNDHKHTKWVCECECGVIKSISGDHLRRTLIVSCGCKNRLKKNGDISSSLWYNITSSKISKRSKRRNLDFNLTKEYVYKLFLEQQDKCALSGVDITLPTRWNGSDYTASLDRIDNTKGYIKGNVQWLHKHVNIMKNSFPQEMFIYLCNKITENNKIDSPIINDINNFKWGLNTKYEVDIVSPK